MSNLLCWNADKLALLTIQAQLFVIFRCFNIVSLNCQGQRYLGLQIIKNTEQKKFDCGFVIYKGVQAFSFGGGGVKIKKFDCWLTLIFLKEKCQATLAPQRRRLNFFAFYLE